MPIFFYIIVAALLESLVSFSGAALAIINHEKTKLIGHYIVSFAIGALLGVSFLELIPESLSQANPEIILPTILIGIIIFFALEKFLFWHTCHDDEHRCEHGPKPYGVLILWSDFLHNFIDGIILALAFMVDLQIGVVTLIAVLLHEVPQELADFGILMHSGYTRKRAFILNFLVSLSTLIGALITYAIGDALKPYLPIAIALVAGNFIYLAMADLMPELHETRKMSHAFLFTIFIVVGVIIIYLPTLLFDFEH